MKRSEAFIDAWRFFLEHAGYCTPPGRVACAKHLALAEEWAIECGVVGARPGSFAWQKYDEEDSRAPNYFRWEEDEIAHQDEIADARREKRPPSGYTYLECALFMNGEVVAGLGGISFKKHPFRAGYKRDPYLRVIQAELAAQAMDEEQKRLDASEAALYAHD